MDVVPVWCVWMIAGKLTRRCSWISIHSECVSEYTAIVVNPPPYETYSPLVLMRIVAIIIAYIIACIIALAVYSRVPTPSPHLLVIYVSFDL